MCAKLGSLISVSDPESKDMLRTSILDISSLLGTKLLEFASGSESGEICKISIIYSEILFLPNINSDSGFFYSKFSGTDSILVSLSFSKLYETFLHSHHGWEGIGFIFYIFDSFL